MWPNREQGNYIIPPLTPPDLALAILYTYILFYLYKVSALSQTQAHVSIIQVEGSLGIKTKQAVKQREDTEGKKTTASKDLNKHKGRDKKTGIK